MATVEVKIEVHRIRFLHRQSKGKVLLIFCEMFSTCFFVLAYIYLVFLCIRSSGTVETRSKSTFKHRVPRVRCRNSLQVFQMLSLLLS